MSWLYQTDSVDSSSEAVDLLVGITDKDLGTSLVQENVQHG